MSTPFPWWVATPRRGFRVEVHHGRKGYGAIIAEFFDEDDARRAVRAGNLHDELVAALREVAGLLTDGEADDADRADVYGRVHAALAKVDAP